MNNDVLTPKTPNESLSESVVKKLVTDKLIADKDKDSVLSAMASGKVSPADWLQWIENKIDIDDKGGEINAD